MERLALTFQSSVHTTEVWSGLPLPVVSKPTLYC